MNIEKRNLRVKRKTQRPSASRTSDFVVILFLTWMVLPEAWTKPITVGEVPIPFFLTQILALSLLWEPGNTPTRKLYLPFIFTAVCCFACFRAFTIGPRNNFSFKFFVADIWSIEAIIVGMMWSFRRTLGEMYSALKPVAVILAIATPLSCFAVFAGLIAPLNHEYVDRFYTGSLWNIGIISLFLWPIFDLLHNELRNRPQPLGGSMEKTNSFYGVAVLGSVLTVAIFTATRNLLILSVVALLLSKVIGARKSATSILKTLVILTVTLVVIFVVGASVSMKGASVMDRLSKTDVQSEERWEELSGLLQQLDTDWVLGWGMGSQFNSPVMYQKSPLADAPHIGVATYLLKGGLPALIVFILIPLIMATTALLRGKTPLKIGSLVFFLYIALSCISGGWYAFETFFLGVSIGLLQTTSAKRSKIKQNSGVLQRQPCVSYM